MGEPDGISSAALLVNQNFSFTATGGMVTGYDSHKCHGISSTHVGGAHVLMADGSVRFLSNNIGAVTLQAISSKAAGESVGDF